MKSIKKLTFYLLVFSLISLGCSDNQTEFTTFKYFESSTIETQNDPNFFLATIENGNNLVFEYEYVLEADPDIADSGFSETILFEIDPTLNEFTYSNQELVDSNTYYRQLCFCPTDDSILITNGTISGRKLTERTWEIDILIDIDFPSGLPFLDKQVSGVFVLSN